MNEDLHRLVLQEEHQLNQLLANFRLHVRCFGKTGHQQILLLADESEHCAQPLSSLMLLKAIVYSGCFPPCHLEISDSNYNFAYLNIFTLRNY